MPDRDDYDAFLAWQRGEFERTERRLLAVVRDAVAAMIRAAVDAILGTDRAPDPDEVTAAAYQAWRRELAGLLDDITDLYAELVDEVADRTIDLHHDHDDEGDRGGGGGVPDVEPYNRRQAQDLAQEYVRDAENRLARVPDEVWRLVADALAEGYAEGDTPEQLARRVAEHVDDDGLTVQHRANRIARTETTMAYNSAAMHGLRYAETVLDTTLRKSWVATYDGRTRATHRAANRQEVAIDEPFTVGGVPLMFPGDPTGPPGEVINCRCIASPVPAEFVPDLDDDLIEAERQRQEAEYRAGITADTHDPDDDEVVDIDAAIAARSRMPRQLREYWKRRIPFGAPGSFRRCVVELTEHVGPDDARGACANLYHEATGRWPGRRNRRSSAATTEGSESMGDTATLAADDRGCGCGCGCTNTTPEPATGGTVAAARLDSASIVAQAVANAPDVPPAALFEPREFDGPTPVTVTADGGVFGHIAPWHVPHRGIHDEDVTAPESRIAYDLFHNRDVVTAEGTTIRAGVLLVGCDHAPNDMDVADARDYHDRVCTPAAVVRAYEDEHGIAFAGALLPGLTVDQVNQLTHLSGEWRSVQLELMAAVGVDDPGFPVAPLEATTVAVTASAETPEARRARAMVAHIPRTTLTAAQHTATDVDALADRMWERMQQHARREQLTARVDQTLHRYAVHQIDQITKGNR